MTDDAAHVPHHLQAAHDHMAASLARRRMAEALITAGQQLRRQDGAQEPTTTEPEETP